MFGPHSITDSPSSAQAMSGAHHMGVLRLAQSLARVGRGLPILAAMSASRERLLSAFRKEFGRQPALVAEAPGRINLIGEHTDYNDGLVLPVAIDRTVAVAAAPGDGRCLRVLALDYNERDEFTLDKINRLANGGWRNYVRGVAWALADAGFELPAADLAITGDVPQGAGLSSSAALEVAVAGALTALSGREVARRDLALLCRRAENDFAGVQSGIMDQFAAALSQPAQALFIDCRSLEVEYVPLPLEQEAVDIVAVDSGVARRLGDTPYNERRRECAEAAKFLAVASVTDANWEMLAAARPSLPERLFRRARHVIGENKRVREAADSLRRADLTTLGALLRASHESLRDDFEVSTPELDLLVELAWSTEGVIGARLTGAGFGGCTVNLVHRAALSRFDRDVLPYREQTGLSAASYACRPAAGLTVGHV